MRIRARCAAFVSLLAAPACSLLSPLGGFAGDGAGGSDHGDAQTGDARGSDGGTDDGAALRDGDAGDAAPAPAATYAAAVIADRPLAQWRLEETSGTVARDELGMHDGTYVLAPTLESVGFLAGTHAVAFPTGTTSRIAVSGNVFRCAGNATYTIELWVLPKAFRNYQFIGGTEKPRACKGARSSSSGIRS